MIDGLVYAPVLLDLFPKLIRNETATEFVTSDAPAVLHNQWLQEVARHVGVLGLAMSGLQVLLPLSPRYLLALYDDDVYTLGPRSQSVVSLRDERAVIQLNSLHVTFADQCIYYGSEIMRERVERLPWHLRDAHERRSVAMEYFAPTQPNSRDIVAIERASRVRVSGPFALHRKAQKTPMSVRARSRRPDARVWADFLLNLDEDAPRSPVEEEIVAAVRGVRRWQPVPP